MESVCGAGLLGVLDEIVIMDMLAWIMLEVWNWIMAVIGCYGLGLSRWNCYCNAKMLKFWYWIVMYDET